MAYTRIKCSLRRHPHPFALAALACAAACGVALDTASDRSANSGDVASRQNSHEKKPGSVRVLFVPHCFCLALSFRAARPFFRHFGSVKRS